MVRTLHYYTEDEILAVHTNGDLKTFAKITPLKLLPVDIHINEYSMANILLSKDVSFIPGVHITMDSSK